MATTKNSTRSRAAKPRVTAAKADQSLAARTGRTIKDRPYTSAAIATGAVTAVAAIAAGALLLSRRDKSLRQTGEDLTAKIKDGFSDASDKIKEIAARGSKLVDGSREKSQVEIAEEALTLKEIGKPTTSPIDDLAADPIKTGVVAY